MNVLDHKEEFKARVRAWARKIDVEVHTISIRHMKNKWASYTKASDLLIFDLELIKMGKELSDYVIVHELLHFVTPNHGKLWKSLMHAYLGNYEEFEKRLRKYTPSVQGTRNRLRNIT
jgi:hypothetical protein